MRVEFTFQSGRKTVEQFEWSPPISEGPPGRIHAHGRAFYWRGHEGGFPHPRTELYLELNESGEPVCNRGCIGEHDPRCSNGPNYVAAKSSRTYDRDELLDAALALVSGGVSDPVDAVARAKDLLDAVDRG